MKLPLRLLTAGLAVTAVAVGAVRIVLDYRSGQGFHPVASDREMQNNQVLFPDSSTTSGIKDENNSDENSFWEREHAENEASHEGNSAGYLFGPNQLPEGITTGGLAQEGNNASGPAGDNIYEIVDDGSGGDIILPDGGNGKPTPTPPQPKPSYGPSSKDELNSNYVPPSLAGSSGNEHFGSSTADILKKFNNYEVRFTKAYNPNDYAGEALYRGQTGVDQAIIFQSLEAFVWDIENDLNYYWTLDDLYTGTNEESKCYVRIDGISFGYFEGEKLTEFPVDIPEDEYYAKIYISYRLSLSDDWTEYEVDDFWFGPTVGVTYELMSSRTIVLNSALTSAGQVIKKQQILNLYNQYTDDWTGPMNLLQYQESYLGKQGTRLTQLFPGWNENGERVPFIYEAGPGRHVLEPAAKTALDSSYQVEMETYWMASDYSVSDLIQWYSGNTWPGESLYNTDSKRVLLQTLTAYLGKDKVNDYLERLVVPQYVQAVQFNYYHGVTVDYLELPDTVLYVNTKGIPSIFDSELLYDIGLQVNKGYIVAAGNPRYTAADGILYNLEQTEMLGVPAEIKELKVAAGITRVLLPYQNQIDTLLLETDDGGAFPEINYQRLQRGCRIVVPDELLSNFLNAEQSTLQRYGLSVIPRSQWEQGSDEGYLLRDHFLMTSDMRLYQVKRESVHWLTLPNYITGVEANALRSLQGDLMVLILPQDGKFPEFSDNCFDGYEKITLACYSQQQKMEAEQLAKAYPDTAIRVRMVETYSNYSYLLTDNGYLLLSVPEGIRAFNGTFPTANGVQTATVIGDNVFEGSLSLRWVTLPRTTSAIGYQAFKDCANLEGVLIDNRDTFLFSNGALENCSSLRFVASNAAKMVLEDPEFELVDERDPSVSLLFAPTVCSGYSGNWVSFMEGSGVKEYQLMDCTGTKVLFAVDAENVPWLALRSGGSALGTVYLPATTSEIFKCSFAGARGEKDSLLTLNWDELVNLIWIDEKAFTGSDLGADVVLPMNLKLGTQAFSYCYKLNSMVIPGDMTEGFEISDEIFYSCENLTSVTLGRPAERAYLGAMVFAGTALRDLNFTSRQPISLSNYDFGMPYYFEMTQEEKGLLKIHVPEGSEEEYLAAWRYNMVGYPPYNNQTGYQLMWDNVTIELRKALGRSPTNDEVRAEMDSRLLTGENRLRMLLGMEQVTEVIHPYRFEIDEDGMITLVEAKGIGGFTYLSAEEMELPTGWLLDYIAAGAFRASPNLRDIYVPETLAGIHSGAFEGLVFDTNDATDGLNLYMNSSNSIFALLLAEEGIPFDFGVDSDRIRVVSMDILRGDESAAAAYIQQWTLPMAGYSTIESLEAAVREQLGAAATDEQVCTAMEEVLLKAENRVRTLLDYVDLTDHLTFQFEWSYGTEEAVEETAPAVDPVLPVQPEIPEPIEPEESKGNDKNNDKEQEKSNGEKPADEFDAEEEETAE